MPHIITDITILKYTVQKKKYSLEEVVYIGITIWQDFGMDTPHKQCLYKSW
jgi:hypothetical protein